jgi:hypothetical protein
MVRISEFRAFPVLRSRHLDEGMDASRETISRIAVREIKTVPPGDQKSRPMADGELASTRR